MSWDIRLPPAVPRAEYRLACDVCRRPRPGWDPDPDAIARVARAAGWRVDDGGQRCPGCRGTHVGGR